MRPRPVTYQLPRLCCLEAALRPILGPLGNRYNRSTRSNPQTQTQTQAPMPLPTLDSSYLMPPPLAQVALFSDPSQSTPTEPPFRHSTPSFCVSKRKRECYMSQDEDSHRPTTSQLHADPNPSFSTTTITTLNSSATSRVIRDPLRSRGGRSGRIPVPLVKPKKTPQTHLTPDGHSASHNVSLQQQSPVDSMDRPHSKRREVNNGQSPTGLGTKETNASMFQPIYGHSPTNDAPGHSAHTTHESAHIPAQSSTYAGPILNAPPQWTSGGNVQVPEHYFHTPIPTPFVQPVQMQAHHQLPHSSTSQTTGAHQAYTPAGPPCIGFGLNFQSTLPIAPGHDPLRHIPPNANTPLPTRSVSSPTGPSSIYGGYSPLSAIPPRVLKEPAILFPGDNPIRWPSGPSATNDELKFSPLNPLTAWDGVARTAHSQLESPQASGVGASFNPYPFEQPISTPQYNQLLASIGIPGGHHFPSVPLWPAPAGISLVEDPSSHLAQPLVQANLTTSGQTPNSGGEPNGSDININVNIARKTSKPVSSNQQIGPDRGIRTHPRRESNPYQRPTPSVTRKTRPVKHEDDLERLKQRCRKQGADEDAIGLLGKVFANEVSKKALTRALTDEEAETKELGIVTGKVYTAFLEPTDEGEGVAPRYICRLCHSDQTWKHAKDVVRHLKRDHLGLADTCNQWYASSHCYHKAKPLILRFPGTAASKNSIPEAR